MPAAASPTVPTGSRANIARSSGCCGPSPTSSTRRCGRGSSPRSRARIAGAEMGAVLGWMSTRVLGQYDMLVLEEEGADDQDIVYYVGPNILALEKRFGFPPREFRLWVALHEVTHRTQFTGVPWLRRVLPRAGRRDAGAADPDPPSSSGPSAGWPRRLRTGSNPLARRWRRHRCSPPRAAAPTMDRIGGLDEPARGPRRRDHGPRRRRRDPLRRPVRRGAAATAARAVGSGQAAPATDRPRGEDGPVRAGRAVHRGGRGGRAARRTSNRAFESPAQLPTLAEIRDPDAWMRGSRPLTLAAGS